MKPALLVCCGAIAMAWLLPWPLGRLSRAGVTPRLAIVTIAALVPVFAATGMAG
jgi:hypothetical protein